ncbi:pseudouridylate synthase PUS7L [Anser cygnoides]|uniref:pseudouridylate synthase PUS7L n=1 Tax=Anser cygnoides TaxID=8845 RepID=UPI0034D15B55
MLPSFGYAAPHSGFRGTLKGCPGDFVVTELPLPQRGPKEPRAEPAPLRAPSPGGQQPAAAVPEPPGDPVASCLGEEASERLARFARALREAWGGGELSLGSLGGKAERAGVHSAVRQRFPFLATATRGREVVVRGDDGYRELRQLVSEREASGFFRFLDAKVENSTFSFEPDGDKEHRKAVHHLVSRRFGKLLETKTFAVAHGDQQANMAITVRFRGRGSRKRCAEGSLEKQELYTAFTLQKENLETLEAIGILAAELGVLPSDFSYTGIKDKKAITYQPMVVKKVTPERLKEIGSKMEKKGMKIHNIHSASQHLRLGQLKGNHFDIIVRDLKLHSHDSPADLKERISEAMENIKTKGFVNYYGPQRFGQGQNVQTDQIGLALLNEKMVEAVKLFFTPEDTDDPVNKAKRYFLQTEDAKGTLTMLPECKVREKMMLRALNRYGVNHEGCTRGWLSIPHSMRIFYVHAYCSKIWNEAASYRLEMYGSKVVEGDLVFTEENDESLSLNDKVHVVTASEESANKYSIYQVVLPMVGHSIKYPSNKVGQWYHERLSKDELQICKFRVPPLQLNIPGCYRHILKNVQNLSYFIEGSEEGIKNEDNHLNESKLSLHISFDLDPSCYATVCLREIMKCDF